MQLLGHADLIVRWLYRCRVYSWAGIPYSLSLEPLLLLLLQLATATAKLGKDKSDKSQRKFSLQVLCLRRDAVLSCRGVQCAVQKG